MILDILKDCFAIVAWRGNSAAYPANSPRALMMAVPDSDIILTDVTACENGVLFCSNNARIGKMSFDQVEDMDVVPLRMMMNWAKETDKHLLLNASPKRRGLLQRIVGDSRFFGVEDRVSMVTRSLTFTKYARSLSDKVGIVGILDVPRQYAAFYKAGGNVGVLAHNETSPKNVRLVGASGIIMANPEIGREALRRRGAKAPACVSFCPD